MAISLLGSPSASENVGAGSGSNGVSHFLSNFSATRQLTLLKNGGEWKGSSPAELFGVVAGGQISIECVPGRCRESGSLTEKSKIIARLESDG